MHAGTGLSARLTSQADGGDWDAVASLLDDRFFELLLTDGDQVRAVLATAPADWFAQRPRQQMQWAIAAAAEYRSTLLDDAVVTRFAAWVRSQDAPAARDVLGVLTARLRVLLAAARFRDAAAVADEAVRVIDTAEDVQGFQDVLPSTLIRCGTAKLLAGAVEDAAGLYHRAVSWATGRGVHPLAEYAADHLGLALCLGEDYRGARQSLDQRHWSAEVDDSPLGRYQQPRLLARALLAVAAGDTTSATALLDQATDCIQRSEWWWVAAHLRARAALLDGATPGATPGAIMDLAHVLRVRGPETAPGTTPGSVLRADLADLHQAAGSLDQARHCLDVPGLVTELPVVAASVARLELLSGHPERADDLLRAAERLPGGLSPQAPTLVVLRLVAEAVTTRTVRPAAARIVAGVIEIHQTRAALANSPAVVRAAVDEHLPAGAVPVPEVFPWSPPVRLTRRETEILLSLRDHATIPALAGSLHVSPNTVKSHLRRLYRKLGVHTRAHALAVGLPMLGTPAAAGDLTPG